MTVLDPETLAEVPADGQTMGEIMFRGNIVMKGYLKNPAATAKAFAGGWFHTGDLAVMEPDRYVKIKDRSKDIIISGGENISCIEVEDALYRHPAVLACAVVARPDPKWGETPVAFVETQAGCRGHRGRADRALQGPAGRLQGAAGDPLRADPEDQHRQDPEVPAARARQEQRGHRVGDPDHERRTPGAVRAGQPRRRAR